MAKPTARAYTLTLGRWRLAERPVANARGRQARDAGVGRLASYTMRWATGLACRPALRPAGTPGSFSSFLLSNLAIDR